MNMNARVIALIIVFAALTVVLNPAVTGIGVPAPYLPFLVYQIWEIPIVVLFLLVGPKYAIPIAVLNAFVLLALFIGPGGLPTGPFYNLAANLSMLLGVYVVNGIFAVLSKPEQRKPNYESGRWSAVGTFFRKQKLVLSATALAIIFRVAIMTLVNYATLRYPFPIGYSIPEVGIIPLLPPIGLFNATLALYTVPLGYAITNVVKRTLGSHVEIQTIRNQ
jgi:riboflavin transporter FmnP